MTMPAPPPGYPLNAPDIVSDVVVHLSYTARDGGSTLKTAAEDALRDAINAMGLGADGRARTGLFQAFSARRDFPSEWHRFLHTADADGAQTLALDLSQERFPYVVSEEEVTIEAVHLFLKPASPTEGGDYALVFSLTGTEGTHAGTFDAGSSPVDDLPYSEPLQGAAESPGAWRFEVEADGSGSALRNAEGGALDPDAVEDLVVVCEYRVEE